MERFLRPVVREAALGGGLSDTSTHADTTWFILLPAADLKLLSSIDNG